MTAFPFLDLREWISFLEERGQLVRNPGPVDLRNEVSAISRRTALTSGPAVLHESVRGYPGWRIFTDGLITRQRQAWALGLTEEHLAQRLCERLAANRPIKPELVRTGPCKEEKLVGDDVDLTRMPLAFTGELEGPPYITAGISNVKDPETGWQNTGIRRFQLKGPRKVTELFLPFQHEGMIYAKHVKQNKATPVAIVIGADPLYYLASQVPAPAQVDEMDTWGAVAGRPLEVVRCETSDLLVPAHAEIVLEGEIDRTGRELEGSFPEFSGYYGILRRTPVVNIHAVTCRRDAIYLSIYNGAPPAEGATFGATMSEVELYRSLKEMVPEIVDVALISTWGGVTVVSIKREPKERVPGLAKRVAMTVKSLKASVFVKNLFIVDEDIDVHDPHQLLWCLSVRFQGAKDLTVIPGVTGNYLDPSEPWLGMGQGYTSYTTFDCTEKPAPYDMVFRRGLARPAADVYAEVSRRWGPAGYSQDGV